MPDLSRYRLVDKKNYEKTHIKMMDICTPNRESWDRSFPHSPQKENPCRSLDFRLQFSRKQRQYTFVQIT